MKKITKEEQQYADERNTIALMRIVQSMDMKVGIQDKYTVKLIKFDRTEVDSQYDPHKW